MKPDPAAMSIAQADAYVVAAEALADAARKRRIVRPRRPAHRGFYVDHTSEEMHDLDEACDLCEALAKFERVKAAQK